MLAIKGVPSSFDGTLARIRDVAPRRDQTSESLGEEIAWLQESGLLVDALPPKLLSLAAITGSTWSGDPLALSGILRLIGAASLPVGRLIEGHVNAAQLIGLYAPPPLQQRCADAVRGGALLGVWGADGEEPLIAQATATGFVLSGSKAFCSGLGVVAFALVSASVGECTRLFCIDVRDSARADHTQWQVSGMRATQSGGYDFSGIVVPGEAVVGGPDDYYAEPHFLGGMYRMCAVQVGGLDELFAQVVTALCARGKAGDAVAKLRVGRIAGMRALAAQATEALARRIAEQAPADEIAREAVLMREGVERCIVGALEITERCLGTEVHRENSTISRLRRDLSVYIRQAAVDERLMAVGSWYLANAVDDALE